MDYALKTLIAGQTDWRVIGDPEVRVRAISADSRRIAPGALFVAIRGEKFDGHDHLADAVSGGAVAVVSERYPPSARAANGGGPRSSDLAGFEGVTVVVVPDARVALAELAATFHGHPSERLHLYGVTGTNGKTTVSYLLEALFARAGEPTGVLGTINYRFAGALREAPHTTPDALVLQATLAEMAEAGIRRAVMEVSSHALALHRVRACHFRGAVFTNLTQDHLDYHKDMDAYYEAKERLFRVVLAGSRRPDRFAVLNADDPSAARLAAAVPAEVRVLRFGLHAPAEVRATEREASLAGIRAVIETPAGKMRLESPLAGTYNLYNLLAAVAVGVAEGIDLDTIRAGLESVARVPGRFDRVGGNVVVDYAHTPDALENLLEAARAMTRGRLIVVFGCGGDRDRAKRPLMGEAAARLSDVAIVTSDNPRTEEPLRIIDQIVPGLARGGMRELEHLDGERGYVVIPDRREAIREAVSLARPEDLVVIAGKGHEDYQIVGTTKLHFDDREEAAEALSGRSEAR